MICPKTEQEHGRGDSWCCSHQDGVSVQNKRFVEVPSLVFWLGRSGDQREELAVVAASSVSVGVHSTWSHDCLRQPSWLHQRLHHRESVDERPLHDGRTTQRVKDSCCFRKKLLFGSQCLKTPSITLNSHGVHRKANQRSSQTFRRHFAEETEEKARRATTLLQRQDQFPVVNKGGMSFVVRSIT